MNVAVIPSQAATDDGHILIVGEDHRLKEVAATIVRRQDDTLIVSGVPFGAQFVMKRLPYLAPGVKVEPRGEPSSAAEPIASQPQGKRTEMVSLSQEQRTALIAYLKSNTRMPSAKREETIKALTADAAPRQLIENLEREIARGGGRT